MKRMAKFLDDYRTPDQRPTSNRQLVDSSRKNILPQAASSPKSDTFALRLSQDEGRATPALTHRSMSPTPTSQSHSWHKHSMRPMSLADTNNNTIGDIDTARSPTNISSCITTRSTNFQPTQVSQVEDSYWGHAPASRAQVHSEITPSPIKYKQEFFTARQFVGENESASRKPNLSQNLADSSSPSAKRQDTGNALELAGSVESYRPPATAAAETGQLKSMIYEASFGSERIGAEFHTNIATVGNVTRCDSEHGSELSRVDSQGSSLQRAISMALQEVEADRSTSSPLEKLPLEEAIAARYRQTLSEQHRSPMAELGESQTEKRKGSDQAARIEIEREVVKFDKFIPLAIHSNTSMDRTKTIEAPKSTSEQQKISEVLSTLEKVTEECSRRGHMIEAMVENAANPRAVDLAVVEALESADARSKQLEDQLRMYQTQVEEMARSLHAMRINSQIPPTQDDPTQAAPLNESDHLITASPLSRPGSATAHARRSRSRCESAGQFDTAINHALETEESFQEKVNRWDADLHSVKDAFPPKDSIRRAQEVLRRDTTSLLGAGQLSLDRSRRTLPGHGDSKAAAYSTVITPRHLQVIEPTELNKVTTPRSQAVTHAQTIRSGSQNNLESPQNHRSKVDFTAHPSEQQAAADSSSRVRPLTAAMMPDALDCQKSAGEKIFHRLQLSRIEQLGQVELANLVKNILIQLDVPYDDDLTSTVTTLGAKLEADTRVHDALWHETTKLRAFAEDVHGTLYGGDHIEGAVTSPKCLQNMHHRVEKLQRALYRSRERHA